MGGKGGLQRKSPQEGNAYSLKSPTKRTKDSRRRGPTSSREPRKSPKTKDRRKKSAEGANSQKTQPNLVKVLRLNCAPRDIFFFLKGLK